MCVLPEISRCPLLHITGKGVTLRKWNVEKEKGYESKLPTDVATYLPERA